MSSNALMPLSALLSFPNSFSNKNEALYLHKEVQALDAQLKFRRELDMDYAKLKHQKLIEDKKELDFQLEFADSRSEKLLNELQKDIFKNISTSNITEQSKTKLDQYKIKYSEYLNYHRSHIQREFNYQILVKQNALIAERAILANQLSQNEQRLKMENEYCDKIHRTNVGLIEEIKRLQLQNEMINDERQKKALHHQALENQLAETIHEKKKKEIKESIILEKSSHSMQESIQVGSNKEKEKEKDKAKTTKVTVETQIALNLNHKYGKLDQIRQSQLDEYIKNKKEEKDINKNILNNNNSNEIPFNSTKDIKYKNSMFKQPQKQEPQQLPQFKLHQQKNTPLTNIHNKTNERKQNQINENSNLSINRDVTFGESSLQKRELVSQLINPTKVKPLQSSLSSNANKSKESQEMIDPLEAIKLSQSIEVSNTNINKKSINNPDMKKSIKESIISFRQLNEPTLPQIKEKEKDKKVEQLMNSSEFDPYAEVEKEKENKSIAESKQINKSELVESIVYNNDHITYEKVISSKPVLRSKMVLPEYKQLVLKKLISKIEKFARTQKTAKQIYTIKHTNTKDSEDALKVKFYCLLSAIKDEKGSEEEFALLEMNSALQLVFELLSSNSTSNLNESNLGNAKKQYDEELFIGDIDEKYKNVIKMILDHMRTMISIKKISLQLACTFMVKGLLNFNHTEIMKSKLLSVLEMHLSQKNASIATSMYFANTFTSGFNTNATKVFHQSNTKLPPSNPLTHSSNVKRINNSEDIFEQYE